MASLFGKQQIKSALRAFPQDLQLAQQTRTATASLATTAMSGLTTICALVALVPVFRVQVYQTPSVRIARADRARN